MRLGRVTVLWILAAPLVGAAGAGCGATAATGSDGAVDLVVEAPAGDAGEGLADGGMSDGGGVSLSRDIFPFVFARCATSNCHDRATVQNHNSNFSSVELLYNRWVNGPGFDFCAEPVEGIYVLKKIVVPGLPEQSFLLEKLTSTREEMCREYHWPRMPPPPAPPLSPDQIERIRRWIAAGAVLN